MAAPAPSSSSHQLQGQTLGSCRIDSVLGRGGMGMVYLGTHLTLGIPVAIKVLPPHLMEEPELIERLYREARRVARLDHPNIVRVLDVNSSDGWHYIVMQYVDGPNLQQVLNQQGPLAPEAVAGVLAQTLEGLAWAHGAGVVHRDIKPANLMQTSAGVIKIADFGLVRDTVEATAGNVLTRTGQALGTPAYMPLEQWEGADVDHRADVYSLGVSGWQLLTGRVPFEDDSSPVRIIHQLVYGERPRVDAERPDVPADFADVIQKMMATRAEDRYADANEARTALQGVIVANGWSAALPPFSVSRVPPGTAASSRRRAADAVTDTDPLARVPSQALPGSRTATHRDGPPILATQRNDADSGGQQPRTLHGAGATRPTDPVGAPVPMPTAASPTPVWVWGVTGVVIAGAVIVGVLLGRGGLGDGSGPADPRPTGPVADAPELPAIHTVGDDNMTRVQNDGPDGDDLSPVPRDFDARLDEMLDVLEGGRQSELYRFLRGIGADRLAPPAERERAGSRLCEQLTGRRTAPELASAEFAVNWFDRYESETTLRLRIAGEEDERSVRVTWILERPRGADREQWYIDPARTGSGRPPHRPGDLRPDNRPPGDRPPPQQFPDGPEGPDNE